MLLPPVVKSVVNRRARHCCGSCWFLHGDMATQSWWILLASCPPSYADFAGRL